MNSSPTLRWLPSAACIAAWAGAFALSCQLMSGSGSAVAHNADASVATRLLGSVRHLAGRHFYEVADLYFHRGVPHLHEERFEDSLYQRLHREVAPRAHLHRAGQDVEEIMPWLWLTVRADPSNVDAYLTAAFWLTSEMKRPDLAQRVLDEARRANPRDHRIYTEEARLMLKAGRTERATALLDAALRVWNASITEPTLEQKQEKSTIFLYRALLAEARSDSRQALADLKAILALFPDRAVIRQRIRDLESGVDPAVSARTALHNMLDRHAVYRAHCPREEHAHHAHDEAQQDESAP